MSHNTGSYEERLAFGKAKEAEVIDRLKMHFWSVTPATLRQDMEEKIDCWLRWKGVSYSVAIKWRESGIDLGIAAVRPYDAHLFPEQWKHEQWHWSEGGVPWDRDAQHYADLYAVGTPEGVSVYTGASVRRMVQIALDNLARLGITTFPDIGYEIKVVDDKGASGYTAGQKKLIVYIKLDSLERVDVQCPGPK